MMLTDRFMGHIYSAHNLVRYGQGSFCRVDECLGYDINGELAGNLPTFMAAEAIGYHQYSPTRANIVVEQLWTQLVIVDTNHLTAQIGHHEMVLVVVAL
jgi:hypothetical protein